MTQNKNEAKFEAVLAVASRAHLELGLDKAIVAWDLEHCMEHQSLDLEQLYNFEKFDFVLDICGIHTSLNRDTYELENGFLPRCAK